MTIKTYLEDPYKKELGTKVASSSAEGIVLESTIFYPTGGGQPCDTGTLEISGKSYNVVEVKKSGEDVLHVTEPQADAAPGTTALCKINWERRYSHMRYHTALHIIDGVITHEHMDGTITGGIIYEDRAHMDLDLPSLNREIASKLISGAQAIVEDDRKVYAKSLTREEALALPDLARSGPGKELLKKLNLIRVIEIEGLDMQLDGGTHVASTKEVGIITLSKFENKGSHRKRIEIKLS